MQDFALCCPIKVWLAGFLGSGLNFPLGQSLVIWCNFQKCALTYSKVENLLRKFFKNEKVTIENFIFRAGFGKYEFKLILENFNEVFAHI